MSLVVLRDAMGVRRSSGLQARNLNLIGKFLSDENDFDYRYLKEVSGHTPLEVVVGTLLGVFISCAYQYL
jgi:acid phosphatase family membrane protein YuiD